MYRLVKGATISLNDKKIEELHNFLQVLGMFLSKVLLGPGVSHACAMTILKKFQVDLSMLRRCSGKNTEKNSVLQTQSVKIPWEQW